MASDHNAYQRAYFGRPERTLSRMAPGRSRYVLRHLDRVLEALELPAGAHLLELGAGMGRFSLLLAERGYRVTAVDLSAELLGVLAASDPERRIETLCCDACAVDRSAPGPFDGAAGFFFLHHLDTLAPLARSLSQVLAPGARVAFSEPNAFNPSFYAQILLTPGMSWRGDGGVRRMRPGALVPAFREAGFVDVRIERYGLFPPALANTGPGARIEEALERLAPLRPVLAFQILSATYDG